ncbi:TIGR00303 family protein [Thermococcus siculi]|uniref:UPF0284 protein A3L11_06900 n=1 Tax=Thermococcus siculi TaxID=72803 RepID=A0A2Z2MQN8_9EURY|nr:TIGR00303 family protein [Thermococcus siculi]ASJ08967.1 TIGR00303 family protein [Thermococcus siculi]
MKSAFILVLGNTDMGAIPEIMPPGVDPELTKLIPPAEAEYLFYERPKMTDTVPMTPEGLPTPVIITKAAKRLVKFPVLVVRGGTYLVPSVPYVHVSDAVGGDFRKAPALPEFGEIIRRAKLLGEELSNSPIEEIVIGESVPGGRATARAVLLALGYDAGIPPGTPGSSQSPEDSVVIEGFRRVGIDAGSLQDNPLEALRQFGDPAMAAVVGIALGFRKDVVLAGGTRMLAVSALLKALGEDLSRFMIATTEWVVGGRNSPFLKIAGEVGAITYAADLKFSGDRLKGPEVCGEGHPWGDAGAGGATWLAIKGGFSPEDVSRRAEELYWRLVEMRG